MAKKTKRKTKRKLAHPKLPMQGQLNLRHEGTHFDLRPIFDGLNERYVRGRLRGYKVTWGRRRKHRPREYFILARSRKKTALSESTRRSINLLCRHGFCGTCSITRCCILWCRMRPCHKVAAEFIRKNSTAESANFQATGAPDAGNKKISRVFCARPQLQCVSAAGVWNDLSDGDGVVATFFLIRYQSVVASSREINFARQFVRISFFIIAVQQNFRDTLAECFRSEIALDSPPVTNGNGTRLFGDNHGHRVRFLGDP